MSIPTKILLSLSVLLFISCDKNDDANPPPTPTPEIQFVKTLGGSLNESAQSIIKTNDGGYAIAGYTQSNNGDINDKTTENFDYWFLKFDENDNLQESKTFGGSESEKAHDIIQTNDGGFVLIGESNSNDGDVTKTSDLDDIWIVKLDASGNIAWEKTHGFSGNDRAFSIIQTADSGYFISGILDVTASGGDGNDRSTKRKHAGGDYWGLKLDSNGDKIWRRYFGGTFTDTAFDAIETNDNGFIIIGSSDSEDVDISNNKGTYDYWVVKVNSNGDMVWEESYGGTQIDEAKGIVKTSDGNYLIVGNSRSNDGDISNSKGAADVWLIKISPSGDLIWEKSYGGSSFDSAEHITPTQDGGYIITGNSRSEDKDLKNNEGQNDIWILKINNSGNLEWQKSIGGSNIDLAYSAIELNDESIIVAGESNSSDQFIEKNQGFADLLITKIKTQ